MKLKAKWIWTQQDDYRAHNRTILAQKAFKLEEAARSATLCITADSFYRLSINGRWVADGPCRAWPEHYQYDQLDVTAFLRAGENHIEIIAKYYGIGTFHQVPQEAGLLAQLEIKPSRGKKITILSDESWQTAPLPAWAPNVPKISVQQEPWEYYDARLEETVKPGKTVERYAARKGPWKDLHPRDVALLTRAPAAFRSSGPATVVDSRWRSFCIPSTRLLYPGLVQANRRVLTACAMVTLVRTQRARTIEVVPGGVRLFVNGRAAEDRKLRLKKGENILVAVNNNVFGHREDQVIAFPDPEGLKFLNPVDKEHENPWCFIPFNDSGYVGNDLEWPEVEDSGRAAEARRIFEQLMALAAKVKSAEDLQRVFGERLQCPSSEQMLAHDHRYQFELRRPRGDAAELVENPTGCMFDNAETTVVKPTPDGDIELAFDLGDQVVGYWDFELIADEGVIVDISAIEYITPDGRMQHTGGCRNSLRYVTRAGHNRFTSYKRRSGRYIYLTLRNQKKPISIRKLRVIESTYPANRIGGFACSDRRLDRVWEISARTLELCMEDTFTDCPLYEQTLWVGDARNEAAFAYPVFDATDIGRRCIALAGQSLERYPITGCQVPSSWDTILPAWSFLWGISVWDYYFYSGDADDLEQVWPWVMQNLRGAHTLSDERGLFSGPFWNMFDWSGIDVARRTVTHNSILIVGAIDAALRCAKVLKKKDDAKWLRKYRRQLVKAINTLWDEDRGAYVDSVHADGSLSESVCQHTSFLAVLYDVIPDEHRDEAIRNMIDPPEDMVRVGSPFAIMYLYEALEKLEKDHEVISSIYENYLPMLESGASTVWEVFPRSETRPSDFPTRSHCHAWSSAPVYFLNRIILGVRQSQPGGKRFDISPRPCKLDWARGTTAGALGPVEVNWQRDGETLEIEADAPKPVKLRFLPNKTLQGMKVIFNGREQKRSSS